MKSLPELSSNSTALQASAEDPADALASYFSELLKEPEAACAEIAVDQAARAVLSEYTQNASNDAQVCHAATAAYPYWATKSFEVLLVRLNQVQVAIPLLQIGMVCKIENDVRRLANTPDWFLGLYPYKGKNIKVLDTSHLLDDISGSDSAASAYRYFVTIAAEHYALSCMTIEKIVKLQVDMVRWRPSQESNAWNVGIIPSQMCILLDAEVLLNGLIAQ